MNHLTITESSDGTATICFDGQPILLLEPDSDPRHRLPRAWGVQGIIVKEKEEGFTPPITLWKPMHLTEEEFHRIGFVK